MLGASGTGKGSEYILPALSDGDCEEVVSGDVGIF